MPENNVVNQVMKNSISFGEKRQSLPLDRTLVMGVLNVTPDSFSDGGRFQNIDFAMMQVRKMISSGVDIIDVGGESTRPGAKPVDEQTELKRVIPIIKAIRKEADLPISIDTYKAAVAREALANGADIINDISALRFSEDMTEVIKEFDCPVILMHMKGTPGDMQLNPTYDNVIDEIIAFFEEQIEKAAISGIDRSRIIIDPGVGFGKRLEDNIEIFCQLNRFQQLDCPIMIGSSRKSFIGVIHPDEKPAEQRLGGSIASLVMAVNNGAHIVRVHDVAESVEAIKVLEALRGSR